MVGTIISTDGVFVVHEMGVYFSVQSLAVCESLQNVQLGYRQN